MSTIPTVSTIGRAARGVGLGVVASAAIALGLGALPRSQPPRPRLVPEDASGPLRRVGIHYAPAMDGEAMPVWTQLVRALPDDLEIDVAVDRPADFDRLTTRLHAAGVDRLDRLHPVVVHRPITTWSRDRMAALEGPGGSGVLAPPRVSTGSGPRAGDWEAPFAFARTLYHREPQIAPLVFEGGDLAASRRFLFADANLIGRNLGRGDASRAHLQAALASQFAQDIVWLGDAPGEVPEHHIMMYMVPLDDHRALVGDVRAGQALAPDAPADPDRDGLAARFDRVATLLAARGFAVTRIPVVVLPGAGSYITYTNALFDRDAAGPVVYLPTYRVPALDAAATALYRDLGYRVVPIDVSTIYQRNGSLGCLVNVLARG